MKVGILSDPFPPRQIGGAGVIAFEHAQLLHRDGHEVFVVSTTDEYAAEGVYEEKGIRIYRIYTKTHDRTRAYRMLFNYRIVAPLKKILKDEHPDIVHAHNIHDGLSLFSLHLAKRSGARVFLTVHDVMLVQYGKLTEFINPQKPCDSRPNYRVTFFQQLNRARLRFNPFRQIGIRILLKSVEKVFAVSAALRDVMVDNGITNVVVLRNGIASDEWHSASTDPHKARERYSLRGDVILFGGRLSREKGGRELLSAFAQLSPEYPNATLALFGAPEAHLSYLAHEAATLGIEEKVSILGRVDRDMLPAVYAAASVIVVPSTCFDSLPNVVLEAMAAGKPVVATCLGGSREAVVSNETGFIVNPFNPSELAAALKKLLSDPELSRRMGERGYDRLVQKFSIDAFGKRLYEGYGVDPHKNI